MHWSSKTPTIRSTMALYFRLRRDELLAKSVAASECCKANPVKTERLSEQVRMARLATGAEARNQCPLERLSTGATPTNPQVENPLNVDYYRASIDTASFGSHVFDRQNEALLYRRLTILR
jgi:hypothetical protein